MADFNGTPGGEPHRRTQKYRDEGDGSHAEDRSVLLRAWNAVSLLYQRLTVDNTTGGLGVHMVGSDVAMGGGTEYTEGDTDASITGTAVLWEDTSDTLRPISAAKPLPVNIVAGAGSGGTASTDDSAFGVGSGSGTPVMGLADETSPDAVDEGDVGVVRMTLQRGLHVNLRDAAGAEVSVGGGTQYDEDSAHVSGDKVTLAGVVRNDTRAALSGTDGDRTVLQTNASGDLRVDGSAVTQPISHAALTELAAAIDTEVQVDIVGALPAGANAIGKLAANSGVDIGDVDVTSVVPGTGGTSLGKAEDGAHSTGETGVLALAVRRDTAAVGSDTDGDYSTLNVDANGRLHVNVGNTVTVGSHAVTNAGTFATQVDGAALTALQLIDNPIVADDAAFTPATTSVNMAGFFADESSTDSVDEGDGGAARMTLDRRQITVPQPHSAGGCDIFRSIDLDETEEEVKSSAGTVYGWAVSNLATSTRFLKFYNLTAANTTVGTSTPVMTFAIPGNSSDDVSANMLGGVGIKFDTAITVAATTGVADADTGAPGANEVLINLFYK